jgi:hypothetical protein
METKIKFKAVSDRGCVVTKIIKVDLPEFTEIKKTISVIVNGQPRNMPIHKTVEDQTMEWLDNWDKTDLMYDNDWWCILNYHIHVPKPKVDKKQAVFDMVEDLLSTDELRASFLLTYSRLYKSIKSLSVEKQISAVMESLELSVEAQCYVSNRMLAILRGEDVEKVTMLNSTPEDK